MMAKSLIRVLKKLRRPTKDHNIFCMSVGGLATLITLSLFCQGLIPSGFRVNPR